MKIEIKELVFTMEIGQNDFANLLRYGDSKFKLLLNEDRKRPSKIFIMMYKICVLKMSK